MLLKYLYAINTLFSLFQALFCFVLFLFLFSTHFRCSEECSSWIEIQRVQWLPLSVLFPSWFLMCSSPSLPHLASSRLSPHLFLVMSLVSVYLVSVFPSLPVRSLVVFACSCASCPHGMCSLDFDFWFSDVWFELWFFFFLCTLSCL